MRTGVRMVLAGGTVVALLAGGGYAVLRRRPESDPEKVSADYFSAWKQGRLDRMADLVADPPQDFAAQHRALSRGLLVHSIRVKPGPLIRDGGTVAHRDFEVGRGLAGRGTWTFRSTLRLAVRDHRWRVVWSPGTLHPALRDPASDPATWRLTEVAAPAAVFVARDGRPLDQNGRLQPYLAALSDRFGEPTGDPGWAVELIRNGQARRLAVLGGTARKKIRTTLEGRLQAAAEKAIAASPTARPAAIVAVRPSTGEVLALADGLGGQNALFGGYPPGSTFKLVTSAALLSDGMSPGSSVDCPGTVVAAERTIVNHQRFALGRTSLLKAFARSCNTTFAALAVDRLSPARLAAAARRFGFNTPITPGVPAARGAFPTSTGGAGLAEAAIGQGRVLASPLVMALAAAEVAGGPAHAWFIGYRRDLAFAVLVPGGGSGHQAAVPLAARLLS